MSMIIRAHYDGRAIVPDEPLDLSPDQPLEVEVHVLPAESASKPVRARKRDITSLPFFGMWADREDMRDSVEWVRKEREKWSSRFTGTD